MTNVSLFDLADAYAEIAACNTAHGWRTKRHPWWQFWKRQPKEIGFPAYVALLHSECSEMLEDYREDNFDHIPSEMADVLIRLIDMADVYGIDLARAYRDKMDVNWARPYRHGGKKL